VKLFNLDGTISKKNYFKAVKTFRFRFVLLKPFKLINIYDDLVKCRAAATGTWLKICSVKASWVVKREMKNFDGSRDGNFMYIFYLNFVEKLSFYKL
jgi:hypothetical protein